MEDLKYIQDEKGRIIKVVRGKKQATIIWADNDKADIPYVNSILMIMFTKRGVGGVLDE